MPIISAFVISIMGSQSLASEVRKMESNFVSYMIYALVGLNAKIKINTFGAITRYL
jgi:hypothetical protein